MLNHPKSAWGSVAEYQVSALPFVTSSQAPASAPGNSGFIEIQFPKVTRFIQIQNTEAAATFLLIAFTRNGLLNGFHFRLNGGQSISMENRVRTLFLAGETSMCKMSLNAGLTTIDSTSIMPMSGTLPDGSAGWTGIG